MHVVLPQSHTQGREPELAQRIYLCPMSWEWAEVKRHHLKSLNAVFPDENTGMHAWTSAFSRREEFISSIYWPIFWVPPHKQQANKPQRTETSNLWRDGVHPALLNATDTHPQFILCCFTDPQWVLETPFQVDHVWSYNLLHNFLLPWWHLRTWLQNALIPNLKRTTREKQSWRWVWCGVMHHAHVASYTMCPQRCGTAKVGIRSHRKEERKSELNHLETPCCLSTDQPPFSRQGTSPPRSQPRRCVIQDGE